MSKCKKPFTIRLLSLQKHSLFSLNMKRPTVRPGMCSFGLQKNPRKKKKKKITAPLSQRTCNEKAEWMNNYGKEGLKEGEENNGGRKGEVEGVVGLQNWYLKCKQQSICELYGKIWVCLGDACSYRNISLSYLLKRAFEKSEEGSSVNKFYKNSSCEWKKKKQPSLYDKEWTRWSQFTVRSMERSNNWLKVCEINRWTRLILN